MRLVSSALKLRLILRSKFLKSTKIQIHVKGDWEAQDHKLIPYKEHVLKLIPYFNEITYNHIPREENQLADALATLSSIFKVKWRNEAPSFHLDYLDEPTYCLEAKDEAGGHP